MDNIPQRPSSVRYIVFGVLALIAGIAVTVFAIYEPTSVTTGSGKSSESLASNRLAIELVEDVPHTLRVPEQVRKALRAEAEAGKLQRDPPLDVKAAGKKVRWRLAQNDLGQSETNLPRPPP